jgi:23S rRNA-/tRNA-specific pseudouridylate synthase
MPTKSGKWESHLIEDAHYHVRSCAQGKLAITTYEVVASNAERTLLRLKPLTGRKHQLRVHCSEAGWPIVGDARYGQHVPKEIKRLYLHAQSIRLSHPITHRPLSFSVPIPPGFSVV